jgi:hypothetical protein
MSQDVSTVFFMKVASRALLSRWFFLLFFDHEAEGDMFLQNIGRRYITEDRTLDKYRCENLKFYKDDESLT